MPDIDPDHPAMRTIFAMFDAAEEFGLSRVEVRDTVESTLAEHEPNGPLAEPIISALAQRIAEQGGDGPAFRQHVKSRTGPLMREAQVALGLREGGE